MSAPLKRLWPLLFAAVLFAGCPARGSGSSSGAPGSSAPASSSAESAAAVSPEERSTAPPAPAADKPWEGTSLPVSGPLKAEQTFMLSLPGVQTVEYVALEPVGAGGFLDVRIEAGGRLLYGPQSFDAHGAPELDSRVCRFDAVRTDTLTVTVAPRGGEIPLESVRAGSMSPGGPLPLMAYLPASTNPDVLNEYAASLERLTRVTVITGLTWDADGTLAETDGYAPLMRRLAALRDAHGFELFACVYPQAALTKAGRAGETLQTAEKRAALTASLLEHAARYALDGVDFDWESQRDARDWERYSLLLAETGGALRAEGLSLSAALYPEDAPRLSESARAALDTLNLMAYDQFGALGYHATFSGAAQAVSALEAAGYEAARIALGVPAYGRPLDGAARWPLYRDAALPPWRNVLDGAYYNGPQTVRDKAAFARLEGLQGVFLYHLAADKPAAEALIQAVD